MSLAHKGKPCSDEAKRKLSERTISNETRKKLSLANTGKKRGKLSEEHKLKIKNGNKDKIVSEETRLKIKKSWEKRRSEKKRRIA